MFYSSVFLDLTTAERKDRITSTLRFLVHQSGYTQRALATRMGRSQSYVAHILLGDRSLDFSAWHDWLAVLEISAEHFLQLLDKGVPPEYEW